MRLVAPLYERTRALSLVALACLAPSVAAQEPSRNLFADFETRQLENGLTVWFKQLPGEASTAISVTVPYGAAEDPRGADELAHFVEHMLLSDHLGRTEEEVKREIEDLGGTRVAFTYLDHTFYSVLIDAEHSLFAVDWLAKAMQPHTMEQAVVDRQRAPIALELEAKPRDVSDWFKAWYLDPTWFRIPGIWERDFGIETRFVRDYDPYTSLLEISPTMLRAFYDSYYGPGRMVVTIIGDIEPDELWATVDSTFGALPARPAAFETREFVNNHIGRTEHFWEFRSDVEWVDRWKLYGLTTNDHLYAFFLTDYLEHRLNNRLRFSDRKAAYAVSVRIGQLLPVGVLEIRVGLETAQFDYARGVLEEELGHLRNASLDPAEFTRDRESISKSLRTDTTDSSTLAWYAQHAFYDPALHSEFPDLPAFYDAVTQAGLADFASRALVDENRILRITEPYPISQTVFVLVLAAAVVATLTLAKRRFGVQFERRDIRLLVPLRIPVFYFLLGFVVLVGGTAYLARTAFWLYDIANDAWLLRIDAFWLQWLIMGALIAGTVYFVVWLASRIPISLWVFEDKLVFRCIALRAIVIPRADIAELSELKFKDFWFGGKLRGCTPMTSGVTVPGLYLKTKQGRSVFFLVSDSQAIRAELAANRG